MNNIAFDESGYTGQDLTNQEQPVFCLASVNFNVTEAEELLGRIRNKSGEYKFNKLRKNAGFRTQLETILNHGSISENTVKLAIGHKEYMIVAQIVDQLIEPLAFNDGFDFYKQGLNLSFTNMLYACIPAFCNDKIYDEVRMNFVIMFRDKTKVSIENFYKSVQKLIKSSTDKQFKKTLSPILLSFEIIDKILAYEDKFRLDITSTSFVVLCDHWGRTLKKKFNVIADESKPLVHYNEIYNKLKSGTIPAQEIGYGSRKMHLPLKINELKYVDSAKYPQIQLADLIAGAAAYFGKSLTKTGRTDEISKMIGESRISNLFICPIWPHLAITPEDLNMDDTGNNPLDKLIEFTKDI